jgi:hypothetical protein
MPFPNEHACRIKPPGKYEKFARKNCEQKHDGKCIDVIYGVKQGKSEIQALRYPKSSWTSQAARTHCSGRGGSFEAAKKNIKRKTMSATILLEEPTMTKKDQPIQIRDIPRESYTAVAVLGDTFWNEGRKNGFTGKPEFSLSKALKRDHSSMNGTFHNLDHERTIESLVGTHDDTEYDNKNKRMIIHIYPDEKFGSYDKWKSFISACKRQGYTPNVSIEAFVECEDIPASELPEGTDYARFDIKDDDLVEVEVGYRFLGAATVWRGACSSDAGCGIIVENSVDTTDCYKYNTDNLDCDCDSVTITTDVTDSGTTNYPLSSWYPEDLQTQDYDLNEEADEMPKTKTETNDEPEDKPEEPKGESEDEEQPKEQDIKVNALKEKLVNCGQLREQLEEEKQSLNEKIEELQSLNAGLEEQIISLNETLSSPVTQTSTNEADDDRDIKTKAAEFFEQIKY